MANVTITVPDAFITLYNQRRTTWNAYAVPRGLQPLPALSAAAAERFIRDYLKGLMLRESARLDAAGANDGTAYDADVAAIASV